MTWADVKRRRQALEARRIDWFHKVEIEAAAPEPDPCSRNGK